MTSVDWEGNGCGFSDVRGLGGVVGVVLVTSEASSGMGSDVRGQGRAMGVSLVDSSDVRGLGGGMDVVLVASSGSMRVVWQHKYVYGMCRVFLVG